MIRTHPISITVNGPILTRSTAIGSFGVDAPIARLESGKPYLPGSHILGKLRNALVDLASVSGASEPIATEFMNWFGGDGDIEEGYKLRRRIFMSDLAARSDGDALRTRTRIRIGEQTEAVEEGALLTLEAPYSTGEQAVFEGHVDFVGIPDELDQMVRVLRTGLNWISQAGGQRTVGFGRILKATVGAPRRPEQIAGVPANTERLALVLQFRDPICIAEARNSGNTFETCDVVPGGVIKGALANLIAAGEGQAPGWDLAKCGTFPDLCANFSKLRVSHLFPAPAGKVERPTRWPMSLVLDSNDHFHDAAHWEGLRLINGCAPAFCHDWKPKHFERVEHFWSWPYVPRTLRVRTAIDYDEARAKEAALFAYQMLEPTGYVWIGEIGLEGVSENLRAIVVTQLSEALANGLPGIGRNQSHAMPADGSFVPSARSVIARHDPLTVLTLQTPVLLRAPNQDGYERSIEELSQGALALERHFTTERLSGAEFMANRYFNKGKDYKPWLLTEPGSVFVVRPTGKGNAAAAIRSFCLSGFPVSDSIRNFYGLPQIDASELWRYCPYIPQNGFGEVAVTTFSEG